MSRYKKKISISQKLDKLYDDLILKYEDIKLQHNIFVDFIVQNVDIIKQLDPLIQPNLENFVSMPIMKMIAMGFYPNDQAVILMYHPHYDDKIYNKVKDSIYLI